MISRRQFIGGTASILAARLRASGASARFSRAAFDRAPAYVIASHGSRGQNVDVIREWSGDICRSRIVNRGRAAVNVKEIVLFDLAVTLPPETAVYGEGFQMLSQTAGTLGEPIDLSQYTDAKHYGLPAAETDVVESCESSTRK